MSRQPKAWAETTLMAYVDGELDPAQAATVEAAIRDDPEAQAVVDLMRRSRESVGSAFDRPLREPVPARLLAALAAGDGAADAAVAALRPQGRQPRLRQWLLPLAASILMLLIGFGAGRLELGGNRTAEDGYRPAGGDEGLASALRQALDRAEPGAAVAYAEAGRRGTITLVGPLQTAFGPCLEFRLESTAGDAASLAGGIACRSDEGDWHVLAMPPKRAP